MDPTHIIAGHINREYILPPIGIPLLDVPGGSALYASGGFLVWSRELGILARIGEDYPRAWLKELQARGIDISGIQILQQSLDLRAFHAYNEKFELTHAAPVSQFARRGLTFPKALLGYQNQSEGSSDPTKPDSLAPLPTEIPPSYRLAQAVHLCPMEFTQHSQLIVALRAGSATTITVDPSPGYMTRTRLKDLRAVLTGVTAVLPSEEELRLLFWGETNDLWEMAAALGEFGCELVVIKRGALGQMLYEVGGRRKRIVPAYPARLSDPTGAGDAFCGGFLCGYHKAFDPLQGVLYGNISASLKVEGTGAFYPVGVLQGLAEARLNVLRELVREA